MLEQSFHNLTSLYTDDFRLSQSLWSEITVAYSQKSRHYHTLKHLENLLNQLSEVNDKLENRDAILFTLFYHDIVYHLQKSDNEEKSADIATQSMRLLSVPNYIMGKCRSQILATKKHLPAQDADTNYFLDADLSVLGQDWETYKQYAHDVRKEYSVYPDMIYSSGRRKVLNHFLTMDRIFKTMHFYDLYEGKARENLKAELEII